MRRWQTNANYNEAQTDAFHPNRTPHISDCQTKKDLHIFKSSSKDIYNIWEDFILVNVSKSRPCCTNLSPCFDLIKIRAQISRIWP